MHESNDNRLRAIHFANAKNLIVASTYFPRKTIYKQTWISPDEKTKYQIDHILIGKNYNSKIMNVCSFRGADNDTDHYLVNVKRRIKLSTNGNR